MSEQVAETATVIIRVTPATKAELERRALEFYQVHRVRPSMDAVIARLLAGQPVQP